MRTKETSERVIANFEKKLIGTKKDTVSYLETTRKGIFTKHVRKNILGIIRPSGGRREHGKSTDFWFDRRNQVRIALVDLELFIEVAGQKNVNQVMTEKTLAPIVEALLLHPRFDGEGPDPVKANIARLFVKWGLEYLEIMGGSHVTLPHKRTLEEANNLSNYLESQIILNNANPHSSKSAT